MKITCQQGAQPPVRMAAVLFAVNVALLWHTGAFGGSQVTVSTSFTTNYKGIPLTNSSKDLMAFLRTQEKAIEDQVAQLEQHQGHQAERATVLVLDNKKIDPQFYRDGKRHAPFYCRWIPTAHCTPYGSVDMKNTKACHDIIPQGSSGFCVCPDAQLLGIPCQGFSSVPFQCSRLCKTHVEDYPTHRELLKRYPPRPPVVRPKGVIISFARTPNLYIFRKTLANFEAAFNGRYHYPYQAFYDPNDLLTESYMSTIRGAVSAPVSFTNINPGHWEIPGHINMSRVDLTKGYTNNNLYFRQVSRFFSGFFYNLQEVQKYDWFWRLNEDVVYLCDVYYDPFVLMEREKKVYGYSIMLQEDMETVPTLFNATQKFMREQGVAGEWVPQLMEGLAYSGCHFWSAMTIGSLNWFRNSKYNSYFQHLDAAGGFFYERWADAVVHTLGLALHTDLSNVYYFESIAYVHTGIFHLPHDNSTCTPHPVPDTSYPGSNTALSLCTGAFSHLAKLPRHS